MEERSTSGRGIPVLSRDRLTLALKRLTFCKLGVITAPGGYGKTTLVREFASQVPGTTFCWMQLDPADASLPIFLQQLGRSVARHLPPGGLFSLIPEAAPSNQEALRHLARMVAAELGQHAEDHMVVVLDDLHHVAAGESVMTFLDALIQSLPDSVSLLLASRERPRLPLSRLQARGEVVLLTARDLTFTEVEARNFFDRCLGLTLPERVFSAVMAQTEGWITALLLVGSLLKEMESSEWGGLLARLPGEGPLFDFLAEEVFERQSAQLQEFLLGTCLLSSLQAPVIERLLGSSGAGAILQSLEARNLFLIPAPYPPGVYRYHTLFQAFLQRRLRSVHGEAAILRLHLGAAQAYEGMGNLPEAVEHYLAAGDFARAAPLMAEQVDHMLKSLQHDTVKRWLQQVPAYLREQDPNVLYLRAQLSGWLSQNEVFPALYQRAIDLYEQRQDFRGVCRCLSWVTNRFWKLRHPYFYHSPQRWAAHSDPEVAFYGKVLQAFALTSRGEWRDAYARLESLLLEAPPATRAYFDCLESLAVFGLWIGDLKKVLKYGLMHVNGRMAMGDYAWGIYIWVAYSMLGDRAGLEAYQRQFMAQEVQPAMLRMHEMVGTLGQGIVHTFDQRWDDALACFESLRPYFNDRQTPFQAMGSEATFVAQSEMARIYLRQGRREESRNCLQRNLELTAGYPEVTAMAHAQMAEFLAVEGDVAGAQAHLERAIEATPPGPEGPARITVELAAYKVALAQGDRTRARHSLVVALQIAHQRECPWYLLHTGGPEILPAIVELAGGAGPSGADDAQRNTAVGLLHQLQTMTGKQRAPWLKAYTFGGLRVYRAEQPIDSPDWRRTKVKLLFLLLLMRRGRPVAKDLLTELLWPDAPPSTARTNLRATVHGLKRSLEPDLASGADSRFVHANRDYVALGAPDDIWFDLWDFEEALSRARAAKQSGNTNEALRWYGKAVELCRGQFLPEIVFGDYFQDVRTRTETTAVAACLELAKLRLRGGDHRAAIETARRALTIDRTVEEAYQILIMGHMARGERDRALQVFKTCRKHLRQLLGSEPSTVTRELLQA